MSDAKITVAVSATLVYQYYVVLDDGNVFGTNDYTKAMEAYDNDETIAVIDVLANKDLAFIGDAEVTGIPPLSTEDTLATPLVDGTHDD